MNKYAGGIIALTVLLVAAGGCKSNDENKLPNTIRKTKTMKIKVDREFNGQVKSEIRDVKLPEFSNEIAVEADFEIPEKVCEKLQNIVSQWEPLETFNSFRAYDAGKTDGIDTTGFLGAVFDGRHIYFSPQHNTEKRSGFALRYDTHSDFFSPKSWEGFDAENIDGLKTRGYYGAVFDGQYVYYTPRTDGETYHTRVLRYNTRKPFKDKSAWEAFDYGIPLSFQGGGFDGRYVYFSPGYMKQQEGRNFSGLALRYDTTGPFKEKSGWQEYNAANTGGCDTVNFDGMLFDGQYMYYIPLSQSAPLRFDTDKDFTDKSAWKAFDAKPLGMDWCVGGVFDGKYIYYVPYNNNFAIRYDISKPFTDRNSWQSFDVKKIPGLKFCGYDGGFFDGKYIYFVPFYEQDANKHMNFHGGFVRYDTTKEFDSPSSWKYFDAGKTDELLTVGYNAGAFDGRYFYCAPWHDGHAYHENSKIIGHGRVLRYDTLGENGTFSLRVSGFGHNGGLGGAVPGPKFLVNTDVGVISIAANKALQAGRHTLKGVYDSKSIKLYIDGKLINEQTANGKIINSGLPLAIGGFSNGGANFTGTISIIKISNEAK